MTVKKSTPEDSEILTALTKKSKAYWGYSDQQMNDWSESLTITKNYIETNIVFKLVIEDEIVAYYSYIQLDIWTIKLDNLFVLPKLIGQGLGRLLIQDLLFRIKKTSINKIILESDPHVEKFYTKLNFVKVGQIETSIKDRFLSILELTLDKDS
ncbi:MAG: GNAT family N-acetyltransferase [Chitinophagaceae bacterium]|nr:GNAT family N-acetyltransferase [Chitinophagaceae bacterium]